MTRLDRLLRPRSIAIVGGGFWCRNVIAQCQKIGFAGDIWPVHPTRDTMGGLPAFASIDDLPSAPDATFIGVNRDATIAIVQQLRDRDAGGAICFASGFSEAQQETGDGIAKQAALLTAAGDMPIIGPNCYGIVNYLDGVALWPDQHGGRRVDTGVAIITQSSNIAINLTMQARGLPIAYVLTAGNQAQMSLAQMGAAMLRDPRVTALGLHIEGFGDLREFEELSQTARALGKSIIALKVGKSDQAQAATISHTASLAGSDAGARALLRRLGIGQVTSLAAMLETLKLLHVTGPLSSNRIASMSCSGGEASLMADTVLGTGLDFPPLNDRQHDALRTALGPKVALANPLDYHTYIWGDLPAMVATYAAMMDDTLAMGLVVIDFPRADHCSRDDWMHVIDAVAQAQAKSGRPIALLASLTETMPEDIAIDLVQRGIVPFSGMVEAIEALSIAAWLGQPKADPAPLTLPAAAGDLILCEAAAKAALNAHGVVVPQSATADSPAQAGIVAADLTFPVVLKGQGIAHKTEAGAVALHLTSVDDVIRRAEAMPTDTFLIEEMVTGTIAELLVGVVCDPAHGYVLTLAAGGTLTELLTDSVSLLLPVTPDDITAAIATLKISALLDGYRGRPSVPKDNIVKAVMAVQSYVTQHHPQEVEMNPLMCGSDFAIAADALIKTGDTQ